MKTLAAMLISLFAIPKQEQSDEFIKARAAVKEQMSRLDDRLKESDFEQFAKALNGRTHKSAGSD